MNIEAGKFYRMRCGGAVKIDKISTFNLAESNFAAWTLDGFWDDIDSPTPFDIIAEITEAEYNRIVNPSLETAFDSKQGFAELEVINLKSENERLKSENAELRVGDATLYKKDFDDAQIEIQSLRAQFLKAGRTPNDEIISLKKRLETAERNAAMWEYRACDRGYGDDIEALKAENELLKKQNAEITRMYQGAQNQVEEMFETRRFEAAKAAMQGFAARIDEWGYESLGFASVLAADALLKALEVKELRTKIS